MKSPIQTLVSLCLLSCTAMALSACGNKGPLTLTNPPAGTPAKAAANKTPPAAKPADHISQPAVESK